MIRKLLYGAAVLAFHIAVPSGAYADSLTRPSCWTADFEGGAKRVMCFLASHRLKMTNSASVYGTKDWSICKFSGSYTWHGDVVRIAVPANSDTCSNGAVSPKFSATCRFSGESLACKGRTTFLGKTFDREITLK
jgi:hypothetical protein